MPRLSNQPCPDCGADTLHRAMTCTKCGHINLTPTQHRQRGFQKVVYGRKRRHWNGDDKTTHEQHRTIREAQQQAAVAVSSAPVGTGGLFGKGRGIPRP